MGREEIMASTGFVPAHACWAVYLCAAAAVAATFAWPPTWAQDPWHIGLAAMVISTCVVFAFSFFYSNTSMYDPAWCLLPIFVAVGWMATADAGPSGRGCYSLTLLLAWFARYATWWPWEGWTVGLHTEDWRYKVMADKLGGAGALYWLMSLVSLHMTPSLLVFYGLAPLQRVWTQGSAAGAPLGAWDGLAILVAVGAMTANGIADTQLREFRERATSTSGAKLETENCSKICRHGLWAYSRHPNYCSEASFWLGLALAARAGDLERAVSFGWAWGGSITMFAFFRVSGSLMDARSLRHRKGYETVLREIPGLLPGPAALFIDRFLDRLLIPGFS